MWTTTARIRKHIFGKPAGQPFATREMLGYGKRKSVDKAMERAVNLGIIIRVARGVFCKPLYQKGKLILPMLAEIVLTKAKAFGKELLMTHGKDAAFALKIAGSGNPHPTFVVSGFSSSFECLSRDFGDVRTVHLKGTNPLSKKFADNHVGIFMRAMKHLPKEDRCFEHFAKATESLNRTQRSELKNNSKWMPGWLNNFFWAKPPETRPEQDGPHFWNFLLKYMTYDELVEYKRANMRSEFSSDT
jgi:Family of unknown function (DUF6088)